MSSLGLAAYSSSEDEAGDTVVSGSETILARDEQSDDAEGNHHVTTGQDRAGDIERESRAPTDSVTQSTETPQAGPIRPIRLQEREQSPRAELPGVDPSLTPFSQARQQIRLLTMPPVPEFDIPPSPPRSPGTDTATEKKVSDFLELKRQGIHFNERLLCSSAMSNEGMSDKVLDFAGIHGIDQYRNALPAGLGPDIQHWASMQVEDVVGRIAEQRRRDAATRKGKPREFVMGKP